MKTTFFRGVVRAVGAVTVAAALTLSAAFSGLAESGGAPPARDDSAAQIAAMMNATGGKWIEVSLGRQRLTAWENGRAVLSTAVSTGLRRTPTRTGVFRIYVKYRATRMSGPGYNLPNVPYVMYYSGGYGLHGTYWHKNFGRPMSHGCVNLPTSVAARLYAWAPLGTRVVIHG